METATKPPNQQRIIGLIPAAGYATRLGPLPCSKEIYPVGSKAAGHHVLEKMRRAGITEAFIVIREGKWDIPAHYKDGALVGMHLGYLLVTVRWGVPYTLDQAYPFARDATVALGFPDILFSSDDAYERVIARQARTRADVVLGLFPADRPSAMDVVAIDDRGRITQIVPKPTRTALKHTWGIAVWAPPFTEFLHDYLGRLPEPTENSAELFVGNVMQAGIESGLKVEGVHVSDKPFIDIGLPENLARILQEGIPL